MDSRYPHSGHVGTSHMNPPIASTAIKVAISSPLIALGGNIIDRLSDWGHVGEPQLRQPALQELGRVAPPVGHVGGQAEVVRPAGEDAAAAVGAQEEELDERLLAGVVGGQLGPEGEAAHV